MNQADDDPDVGTPADMVSPARRNTFAALGYRDYRLFWAGLWVSNTGTWMQTFGLGYFVVQLAVGAGEPQMAPLYLGLVGLAQAVPALTIGLFGGVLADRTQPRQMLVITQLLSALIAGSLAFVTMIGTPSILMVLFLTFLSAAVFAIDVPVRQVMTPSLVRREHLVSAIGLSAVAFHLAVVAGPVLGGILYLPLGIGGIFLINAGSYLAVIVALLLMSPVSRVAVHAREPVLDSLREGLAYVRRDVVIKWTLVLLASVSLLARPYMTLLPAVAAQSLHVGAVELSWLFAATGIGSLAGAFGVATFGNLGRPGIILLAACFTMGATVALFSLQQTFAGALVLLIVIGFVSMLFFGMSNALLQLRAPDGLRGRVMGIHAVTVKGLFPLGALLVGSIGATIGLSSTLFIGGTTVAVITGCAALGVASLRKA